MDSCLKYFKKEGTIFYSIFFLVLRTKLKKKITRNRKKSLLNHFGSANEVGSASLEDLKKVEGISELIAKKIYNYFHLNKNFL